jgi:DNA-binding NarL/FixJ family response regulator
MSIKVFVADDHAVVREGLRMLLEAHRDIEVVGEASDGRQTIQKVKALCPDVVLIDIAMPEMNGIEATAHILKECSSAHVIILSMYSTTEYIFQAIKAGATGYLLKESAGREVIDAIRTVHRGRRYLSEQISDIMVDDYFHKGKHTSPKSPLGLLSSREREVLQLVVEGKSSAEIAKTLNLSPKTVETYRSRLMTKLGIEDIPALVKFAIQHGITPLK